MRLAHPKDLAFCGAIIVVVVDADGKTNDITGFGIAYGIQGDPKFSIVTCVSYGGLRKPSLPFAVTRVAGLIFPIGVVHGDDELAAGVNHVGIVPASVGEVAVVPIDENLHAVIMPSISVFGFRLGTVLGQDVILHPDRDVKVVRIIARENQITQILIVNRYITIIPDGAPPDTIDQVLIGFHAPGCPGGSASPGPGFTAIDINDSVNGWRLRQRQGDPGFSFIKRRDVWGCAKDNFTSSAVGKATGRIDHQVVIFQVCSLCDLFGPKTICFRCRPSLEAGAVGPPIL